jgi:hypothetical protein
MVVLPKVEEKRILFFLFSSPQSPETKDRPTRPKQTDLIYILFDQ